MKVFERYLMKGLLVAIAYVLAAMLALFTFFEFLGQLSSTGRDGGATLLQAILMSVYRSPSQLYQAVPIAVLIGTLVSLTQFARNSELGVLRASGVSTTRLLGVLFKVAGIIAVLTLLLGETVVPAGDRLAQDVRPVSVRQKSGLELSSGFWLKDGTTFINIREVKANAGLVDLQLYEFGEEGQLAAYRTASHGEFVQPDLWRIHDVREIRYSPEGGATMKTASEELWRSKISPDILGVLNVRPERMGALTLINYVGYLSANQQASVRYQVALWKRLVYPMTCFVMVALALPFSYFQGRTASLGWRLFLGVMLGILFYIVDGLSSSLGLINHWSPALSSLGPSLIFILLAAGLIAWVERR